ncbi:hypothetical protein [Bradyrhizobium sp. LA2.1]|uniref:hypothetical protein n=1 Tax=Bradyrhizobium sp. LA2.1 TaxID=3156376 RepID=UPI003393B0F4
MTQRCIARMDGRRQRFFVGRYRNTGTYPAPATTGRHDKARAYDDEAVAALVCAVLNLGAYAVTRSKPWAVIPLPEARK